MTESKDQKVAQLLQQALDALEGLFGTPEGGGAVAVWRLGGSDATRRALAALRAAAASQVAQPLK